MPGDEKHRVLKTVLLCSICIANILSCYLTVLDEPVETI